MRALPGLVVVLLLWLLSVDARSEGPRAAPRAGTDRQRPSVRITTPTTTKTYSTTSTSLPLGGTASDRQSTLARVTWETDAGASGVASGTTTWSASVPLKSGRTKITVRATDLAGNQAQAILTVTLLVPARDPGPVTVEWTYDGAVGDLFRVERCTMSDSPCAAAAMTPVAALPITARSWVDTQVEPEDDYCYRVAVVVGATVRPYSQVLCSP